MKSLREMHRERPFGSAIGGRSERAGGCASLFERCSVLGHFAASQTNRQFQTPQTDSGNAEALAR